MVTIELPEACCSINTRKARQALTYVLSFFAASILFVRAGSFAVEDETVRAVDEGSTNATVITSDSLNYDAEQRLAVFEGKVVVSDPDMNIEAERLTVSFAEDNSVASIKAVGNVVIRQDETVGTGGEAVYHVQEGKVVLSVNPEVRRVNDVLTGETITFFRGSGRMICEPNAMLKMQAVPQVRDMGTSR